MKHSKLLAIVLAALMLLTVVPAAAFAAEDPAPNAESAKTAEELPKKESAAALENYLNNASTYITYTNGNPGFTGHDNGTFKYIESNNAGTANSTAVITSESFSMSVGETITFSYWYQTEATYDKFIFTDNGTQVFAYSGISGGSGSTPAWVDYTYTCTTSGTHTFAWKYQKDGSNDTGSDCVRVMDVKYSRHNAQYLIRAASAHGNSGGFSFATSGDYPFEVKQNSNSSSNDLYVRSTNAGVANSDSTFNAYVYACTDWILSFDYAVSGEMFYDKLIVKVDGTEVASFTELDDFTWHTYGYTFTATGYHTISFTYHKDSSNDSGSDVACIDNIMLDTSPGGYSDRRTYMNTFAGSSSLNSNTQPLITPQDSAGFVPVMNSNGTNKRVRNNTRFLDDSESVFELLITMNADETVSFDYFVSCEPNYDYFQFCVDGEEQVRQSGWNDESWRSYTFTAPSNGTFVLTWKYVKDDSVSKGYDYATVSGISYSGSYQQNLDNMLNVSGGTIHFTSGNPGFVECNKNFHSAATAVNKYWDNSTAVLTADDFQLIAGDVFRFMYYTDTEDGSDYLHFYIKTPGSGSYSFLGGRSGDSNGWQYYEYTATETGTYSFKWDYAKDEGIDYGEDRVFIDNVEIVRNFPNLDQALNPDGMNPSNPDYLSFSNDGDYPFELGEYEGRLFARSSNQGIPNSSCSTSTSCMIGASGATISFDYVVTSETNYDELTFYIDGVQKASFSGNEEGDETWQTYSCQVSAGMHEFTWTYQKDGSFDGGYDTAVIDNVRISSSGGGSGNGDVDGNGTVNVTDAVMALRHAMGIINLTSAQIARGDVDGNGVVNVTDAITILRKAMGIIP